MKKKLLIPVILLVLCFISLLTSCGDYPVQPWVWGSANDPSKKRTTTPGEIGVFTDDGAYTWWTNMQAFRHVGKKDQTYLSYVDKEGNRCLASYNHDTGKFAYFKLAKYERDDHDSAGVMVLPDGRLLAVYVRHNKDKVIRWRISKRPEDITAFGEEKSVECGEAITYAQLHRISDTEYRILYRYKMKNWATRVYDAEKDEWSTEIIWISESSKQYYLWTQEDKQEGKFNLFMTGHPKDGPDQNIRYGYFLSDGGIYTTGDKYIGNMNDGDTILVSSPRDFDIVYEAKQGEHTRLYDVAFMGDRPGVLYGVSQGEEDNSKYYYATYDEEAGSWINQYICDSGKWLVGANMYFGGISFDKKDMQTIYVCRREGERCRIEKWQTKDYGATWTTTLIEEAANDDEEILRPLIPYNAHEDMDVLYMKGNYPSYVKYDTDIVFYAD